MIFFSFLPWELKRVAKDYSSDHRYRHCFAELKLQTGRYHHCLGNTVIQRWIPPLDLPHLSPPNSKDNLIRQAICYFVSRKPQTVTSATIYFQLPSFVELLSILHITFLACNESFFCFSYASITLCSIVHKCICLEPNLHVYQS